MFARWNIGANGKRKESPAEQGSAKRRAIEDFSPTPLTEEELAAHYVKLLQLFDESKREANTDFVPVEIWARLAIDTMRDHGLKTALELCNINKSLERAICLNPQFWLEAIRLYYGMSTDAAENGSDWRLANERVADALRAVASAPIPDGESDKLAFRGRKTRQFFRELTTSVRSPILLGGRDVYKQTAHGVWFMQRVMDPETEVLTERRYEFRTYAELIATDVAGVVFPPLVSLVLRGFALAVDSERTVMIWAQLNLGENFVLDLNNAVDGEVYENTTTELTGLESLLVDYEIQQLRRKSGRFMNSRVTDEFLYTVIQSQKDFDTRVDYRNEGMGRGFINERGATSVVRFKRNSGQVEPDLMMALSNIAEYAEFSRLVRVDELVGYDEGLKTQEDGSTVSVNIVARFKDNLEDGQLAITSTMFEELADRSATVKIRNTLDSGDTYTSMSNVETAYIIGDEGEVRTYEALPFSVKFKWADRAGNPSVWTLFGGGKTLLSAHTSTSHAVLMTNFVDRSNDQLEDLEIVGRQSVSLKTLFFGREPYKATGNVVFLNEIATGRARKFVSFLQLSLDSSPGVVETWFSN